MSNSDFIYKTKGLRVKDGGWRIGDEGWGWRIKVEGWRWMMVKGRSHLKKINPVTESLDISLLFLFKVHPKGVVGGVYFFFPQLYISSSWVKFKLHTVIQLPRLHASGSFCHCCCDCCDCCCDGVITKSTPNLLTKDLQKCKKVNIYIDKNLND